jgi:hypothetical protein
MTWMASFAVSSRELLASLHTSLASGTAEEISRRAGHLILALNLSINQHPKSSFLSRHFVVWDRISSSGIAFHRERSRRTTKYKLVYMRYVRYIHWIRAAWHRQFEISSNSAWLITSERQPTEWEKVRWKFQDGQWMIPAQRKMLISWFIIVGSPLYGKGTIPNQLSVAGMLLIWWDEDGTISSS